MGVGWAQLCGPSTVFSPVLKMGVPFPFPCGVFFGAFLVSPTLGSGEIEAWGVEVSDRIWVEGEGRNSTNLAASVLHCTELCPVLGSPVPPLQRLSSRLKDLLAPSSGTPDFSSYP